MPSTCCRFPSLSASPFTTMRSSDRGSAGIAHVFAMLLKGLGYMCRSEPPSGRSQATHPTGMGILEPPRPPCRCRGLAAPPWLDCLPGGLSVPALPGRACRRLACRLLCPRGSSPGGGSDLHMCWDSVSAAFRIEKPADPVNIVSCIFAGLGAGWKVDRCLHRSADHPTENTTRQWPG